MTWRKWSVEKGNGEDKKQISSLAIESLGGEFSNSQTF